MANRSNLSINEIMGVLDKTGLSSGNSFDMGQAKLGAEGNIRSEIYGRNQGMIDQRKKAYQDQLAKIAEMDQKLSGVYGDPTSSLYIEHAGKRQGIYDRASNTGAEALDTQSDLIDSTEDDLEQQVEDSIKAFNALTTQTKASEVEERRIEREQKTTTKDKKKITEAKRTQFDEAGIDPNNPQIRAVWNNSTPAFRTWFIEKRATSKIKDKIITPKELSYWRGQYVQGKVTDPKKTVKKKEQGLTPEEIKQLSNIYKK